MNCETCKNYEPIEQPTPEIWEPGDGYKYEKTRVLDQGCGVITNGVCHRCPISYQCGVVVNSKPWYVWKRIPPEPLIVKSGGTWVMSLGGINYLWVGTEVEYKRNFATSYVARTKIPIDSRWKPFKEVTLTDEIAKLRPMVKRWDSREVPDTRCGVLIGIHDAMHEVRQSHGSVITWRYARLATPKEIQEVME